MLRKASGTAIASNTLYNLEYLREGEKSHCVQFYKGVIPRLKETVATMVHHDRITGSSMFYALQNATVQVEATNMANGDELTRVVTGNCKRRNSKSTTCSRATCTKSMNGMCACGKWLMTRD